MCAASRGHNEVASLLLDRDADLEAKHIVSTAADPAQLGAAAMLGKAASPTAAWCAAFALLVTLRAVQGRACRRRESYACFV